MIIALDLEGTLIRDQLDPRPRPHLYDFLTALRWKSKRIVMMTAVPEENFREIAWRLADQGAAPGWFAQLEYVLWERPHKDLLQIPGVKDKSETLLIADSEGYIHPEQKDRWVDIETFFDQGDADQELARLTGLLLFGRKNGN